MCDAHAHHVPVSFGATTVAVVFEHDGETDQDNEDWRLVREMDRTLLMFLR